MAGHDLVFTGLIYKDGRRYTGLCAELDVASSGRTGAEARRGLLEAVTLYLETCFRENTPYLRPVPPEVLAGIGGARAFRLKVRLKVAASA